MAKLIQKNNAPIKNSLQCVAFFEIKNALDDNSKVFIDPSTGYGKLETVIFAPGDIYYSENDDIDPEYVGWHTIDEAELKKESFLNSLKALDIVIGHQDIDSESYGTEIIPDGQIADAWYDEEEKAVKGVIVIKDNDALDRVVNRELWGGSLQYNCHIFKKNNKINQENLLPQHFALTNKPRDDRVRLNNEQTDRNIMMPKVEKDEKDEKKVEDFTEKKESKMSSKNEEYDMPDAMRDMQSMMKNMAEGISLLVESMQSMNPVRNEEERTEMACDKVMDILVDSYAVKNNLKIEDLKNTIASNGYNNAIGTYETALDLASRMNNQKEIIKEKDDKIENEVELEELEEETIKNEKPKTDFIDELIDY